MSEREELLKIINNLPDYKISKLLLFFKGIQFDNEIEDDLYCEKLVQDYINDPDPKKTMYTPLKSAKRNGG